MGEFELIVLATILRLKQEAYGTAIRNDVEERTQRTVSVGALYTTLERLEKKQYLSSRMGEPSGQRGGRAKRFYQVEAQGLEQLKKSWAALHQACADLPPLQFRQAHPQIDTEV